MTARSTKPRIAYGIDLEDGQGCIVRTMTGHSGLHTTTVYDSRGGSSAPLEIVAGKIATEVASGGAVCAGCLPVRDSLTRWLGVPFPSPAKARRVLPSALDVQLPFPIEDCVYTFPVLERTTDGQVRALAAVARHEAIERRLAAYDEQGFDPEQLDHEGLALWDEVADRLQDSPGLELLVHLGDARSLVIVSRAHTLLGIHGIRTGPGDLADHPVTRERILNRIRQVLHTYSGEETDAPTRVIWSGPGALESGLRRHLEKTLQAAAPHAFDTLSQPDTALARALARRQLQTHSHPCAFRTGEREHAAATGRYRARSRNGALQAAAAGLLMLGLGAGWLLLLDHKVASAQVQLTTAAQAVTGEGVVLYSGQERLLAERAAQERREREEPLRRLQSAEVATRLVEVLDTARQNKLALEAITVRRTFLSATGSSPDWDQCEALPTYLENLGWTADLKRQDAGADERVHFTVQGGPDAR